MPDKEKPPVKPTPDQPDQGPDQVASELTKQLAEAHDLDQIFEVVASKDLIGGKTGTEIGDLVGKIQAYAVDHPEGLHDQAFAELLGELPEGPVADAVDEAVHRVMTAPDEKKFENGHLTGDTLERAEEDSREQPEGDETESGEVADDPEAPSAQPPTLKAETRHADSDGIFVEENAYAERFATAENFSELREVFDGMKPDEVQDSETSRVRGLLQELELRQFQYPTVTLKTDKRLAQLFDALPPSLQSVARRSLAALRRSVREEEAVARGDKREAAQAARDARGSTAPVRSGEDGGQGVAEAGAGRDRPAPEDPADAPVQAVGTTPAPQSTASASAGESADASALQEYTKLHAVSRKRMWKLLPGSQLTYQNRPATVVRVEGSHEKGQGSVILRDAEGEFTRTFDRIFDLRRQGLRMRIPGDRLSPVAPEPSMDEPQEVSSPERPTQAQGLAPEAYFSKLQPGGMIVKDGVEYQIIRTEGSSVAGKGWVMLQDSKGELRVPFDRIYRERGENDLLAAPAGHLAAESGQAAGREAGDSTDTKTATVPGASEPAPPVPGRTADEASAKTPAERERDQAQAVWSQCVLGATILAESRLQPYKISGREGSPDKPSQAVVWVLDGTVRKKLKFSTILSGIRNGKTRIEPPIRERPLEADPATIERLKHLRRWDRIELKDGSALFVTHADENGMHGSVIDRRGVQSVVYYPPASLGRKLAPQVASISSGSEEEYDALLTRKRAERERSEPQYYVGDMVMPVTAQGEFMTDQPVRIEEVRRSGNRVLYKIEGSSVAVPIELIRPATATPDRRTEPSVEADPDELSFEDRVAGVTSLPELSLLIQEARIELRDAGADAKILNSIVWIEALAQFVEHRMEDSPRFQEVVANIPTEYGIRAKAEDLTRGVIAARDAEKKSAKDDERSEQIRALTEKMQAAESLEQLQHVVTYSRVDLTNVGSGHTTGAVAMWVDVLNDYVRDQEEPSVTSSRCQEILAQFPEAYGIREKAEELARKAIEERDGVAKSVSEDEAQADDVAEDAVSPDEPKERELSDEQLKTALLNARTDYVQASKRWWTVWGRKMQIGGKKIKIGGNAGHGAEALERIQAEYQRLLADARRREMLRAKSEITAESPEDAKLKLMEHGISMVRREDRELDHEARAVYGGARKWEQAAAWMKKRWTTGRFGAVKAWVSVGVAAGSVGAGYLSFAMPAAALPIRFALGVPGAYTGIEDLLRRHGPWSQKGLTDQIFKETTSWGARGRLDKKKPAKLLQVLEKETGKKVGELFDEGVPSDPETLIGRINAERESRITDRISSLSPQQIDMELARLRMLSIERGVGLEQASVHEGRASLIVRALLEGRNRHVARAISEQATADGRAPDRAEAMHDQISKTLRAQHEQLTNSLREQGEAERVRKARRKSIAASAALTTAWLIGRQGATYQKTMNWLVGSGGGEVAEASTVDAVSGGTAATPEGAGAEASILPGQMPETPQDTPGMSGEQLSAATVSQSFPDDISDLEVDQSPVETDQTILRDRDMVPSDPTIDLSKVGSVWDVIEAKVKAFEAGVGDHVEGVSETVASEGRFTHIVDAVKDEVQKDPARFGLPANIDVVSAEQLNALAQNPEFNEAIRNGLIAEAGGAGELVTDAQALSGEQVSGIEDNNAFYKSVAGQTHDVPMTQESYALMDAMRGDEYTPAQSAEVLQRAHDAGLNTQQVGESLAQAREAGTGHAGVLQGIDHQATVEAGASSGREAAGESVPREAGSVDTATVESRVAEISKNLSGREAFRDIDRRAIQFLVENDMSIDPDRSVIDMAPAGVSSKDIPLGQGVLDSIGRVEMHYFAQGDTVRVVAENADGSMHTMYEVTKAGSIRQFTDVV